MRGSLTLIAALVWALVVSAWARDATGAFDIRAVGPRQRGCAGVMAFGSCGISNDSQAPREVTLYGFRPFGVGEIGFAAAACRVEVGSRLRALELSCGHLDAFGYAEQVWLASATLAAGDFRVAPAVRLALASLEEGLTDWALLVDCRGWVALSNAVWVGAGLENPFGLGLRRGGERLATELRASVGIRVMEGAVFGIQLSKANGFPTCLGTAVEWQVCDGLWLRTGLGTSPREIAFGLGARKGWVGIDLATTINLDLGPTHEAGIRLLWR